MLIRRNISTLFISIALTLFTVLSAMAQLIKEPLPRNISSSPKSKISSSGRTKTVTPHALPFWDDFSFADGDKPSPEHWVNSNSVLVNTGIAYEPPTIYAATFDGLNSSGVPYSAEVLATGYRDSLISVPILLGDVPLASRNGVVLSFFYQWQGNGEPPDDDDFLALEIKDTADVWTERFRVQTSPDLVKTEFYFVRLFINGDEFFHNDFQFRFRTFGRLSGPYDTWNIDYVYLNDIGDLFQSFPDRALASEMTSLFGQYKSVPLEHFCENPDFDSVEFDIQNLKDAIQNALQYTVTGSFRNYFYSDTDTTFTDNSTSLYFKDAIGMGSRARRHEKAAAFPDISDPLQFDPTADAIDIKVKLILDSDDENDGEKSKFNGYDLRINDTLSTVFKLHDYYAYDDGTAEQTIKQDAAGNKAMVEFEMLTPEKDFLVGFDIYIPDYGIIANQSMDFIIHGTDGSGPSELPLLVINDRSITRQGDGNFFHIGFNPGVEVQDKFYIGWVAPAVGTPKIGFDTSNGTGNRIFTNTNGIWKRDEDELHGSLMIRAIFGEGDPVTGTIEETNPIALFPNPNKGEFLVKGNYQQLSILSSTGQSVSYRQQNEGEARRISFSSTPGVYIVRLKQGNKITSKKIVVIP